MKILRRVKLVVNTDPQRRCYNGCNYSEVIQKRPWEVLELDVSSDSISSRLEFWRSLNDYAVSQRGEGARCEFKVVQDDA